MSLVGALVWLAQERLLFYPQPARPAPAAPARLGAWSRCASRRGDGTVLAGVLVQPPRAVARRW